MVDDPREVLERLLRAGEGRDEIARVLSRAISESHGKVVERRWIDALAEALALDLPSEIRSTLQDELGHVLEVTESATEKS